MDTRESDETRIQKRYNIALQSKNIFSITELENLTTLYKLLCTAADKSYNSLFTLLDCDFAFFKIKYKDENLYILCLAAIPMTERAKNKGISNKILEFSEILEKTLYTLQYLRSFQDDDMKFAYVVALKKIKEPSKGE